MARVAHSSSGGWAYGVNQLSDALSHLPVWGWGAGLALVGELHRWQIYGVVLAIWVLQLVLSPWWLSRYRFGPVEWLWR